MALISASLSLSLFHSFVTRDFGSMLLDAVAAAFHILGDSLSLFLYFVSDAKY